MQNLLHEYLPILIFIGLAFGLGLVIVIASLVAGTSPAMTLYNKIS